MIEQRMSIERMEEAINVFGPFDENIRLLEKELHVTVTNRDGELKVSGEAEEVSLAVRALKALLALSAKGEPIHEQNVRYVIGLARAGQEEKAAELAQDVVCITAILSRFRRTPSPSAWGRRAQEKLIWRWLRQWRRSGKRPLTASFSPALRWRPVSAWDFCRAICSRR